VIDIMPVKGLPWRIVCQTGVTIFPPYRKPIVMAERYEGVEFHSESPVLH